MTDEVVARFPCFGGTCSVRAAGPGAHAAVGAARRRLLALHARFTPFDPGSELARFNADPRSVVPAGATLRRLAAAAIEAGERTGGLVDATLPHEPRTRPPLALPAPLALRLAPARRAAAPAAAPGWTRIAVDDRAVRRPPGVRLDAGGLAKGLFADLVAAELADRPGFAVDCAGDLRTSARPVAVDDPFGRGTLHVLTHAGGVATSGITRRAWLDDRGRPAHHLLDPATGAPAFTGIVQATALAPTALEAEILAKAALLSGPEAAASWLPHGGLVVFEDGAHAVYVGTTGRAAAAAAASAAA